MKTFILFLMTVTPLFGSEFITFRSDEGSEATYRKYQLTVMTGVEALINSEGEYDHTHFVKVFVRDLDKLFPKLVKLNEAVYYMIYFEKKGMVYKALKGKGPFAQRSSSSEISKSSMADIEKKNCQIILDRLLTLRMIPKPNEDTDKERPKRVIKSPKNEEKK